MKELTIEQKAQRYDEALRIAQELYNDLNSSNVGKGYICTVFPELKENEDEGIRQKLIEAVKGDMVVGGTKDKQLAIDWLEKQGEQKSYSWKPTKEQFEALNYAYNSCSDTERGNYYEGILETLIEDLHRLEKQGEQKPVEPQQDMLSQERYAKAVDECIYGEQKPAETEKGTKGNDRGIPFSEQEPVLIIPKFRVGDEIKTSNEESLTITKIDKKGYWSEDLFICGFGEECLWDLVEQKPACSEEDEKTLNEIIHFFESLCSSLATEERHAENRRWLKFLKSLKPHKQWKPSEEQMDALDDVISSRNIKYDVLSELWKDLKKLREE